MIQLNTDNKEVTSDFAITKPQHYSLEGRVFHSRFDFSYPSDSELLKASYEVTATDTEINYPGLQRVLTPLILGMREIATPRYEGQNSGYMDVHFLPNTNNHRFGDKNFHYWRTFKPKTPGTTEETRESGYDSNDWKVYEKKEILKELFESLTQFSEDLEDHQMVRMIKGPRVHRGNNSRGLIKIRDNESVPLYSEMFTRSCQFTYPRSPEGTKRSLELRLGRSVTESPLNNVLLYPLIVELIENDYNTTFRDEYYGLSDSFVCHDWAIHHHKNGRESFTPDVSGREYGVSCDISKLVRYGDEIQKMLADVNLSHTIRGSPQYRQLKNNQLRNSEQGKKYKDSENRLGVLIL